MTPDPSAPAFPASLEDRYEPVRVLGAGGFGAVFLARDRDLGREVAIKVLHHPGDRRAAQRFQREAECLARLDHPGVVRVFRCGETPEGPYLVMEFLPGAPLKQDPDPVATMLEVADAMHAVHQAGLLHRDLKPSNLVRGQDGRVVLIDFGLVLDPDRTRHTVTGSLVGSAAYMAPELFLGEEPSPASDWYAWGVVLFQLLEGRRPYTEPPLGLRPGDAAPVRFSKVDPSSGAAALVLAALDPDPDRRPTDPGVARDLVEGRAPLPAPEANRAPGPPAAGRRWMAGLLGLCALGVAAGVGLRPPDRAARPGASGGAAAPAGMSADAIRARDELLGAVQQLRTAHRGPGGELHPGRGPSTRHLDDVLAEYRDGRIVTRIQRALRCLDGLATGAPLNEETVALVLEQVTPLLIHLALDEATAQAELMAPRPAYPQEGLGVLRDRLAELARVREEYQDLTWKLPGLVGAELAHYLFWNRGFSEERDRIERLVAQLEAAPTPEARFRYANVVAHFLSSDLWADKTIDCESREAQLEKLEALLRSDYAAGAGPEQSRLLARVALVTYHQLVACRSDLTEADLARLEIAVDDLAVRVRRDREFAFSAVACFLQGMVQHFEVGGGLMIRDHRLVEIVMRAREVVVEARRKAGLSPIPVHFLDDTGLGALGRLD